MKHRFPAFKYQIKIKRASLFYLQRDDIRIYYFNWAASLLVFFVQIYKFIFYMCYSRNLLEIIR